MNDSISSSSSSSSSSSTRGPKKKISNEIRKLIIEKLKSGDSPKDVSNIYQVNYDTVRSMYRTYKKNGLMEKKTTGRRQPILTEEQKERICDWVDEDCSLTLLQLKNKCFEEMNITVSISTIERALKSFHYTIKRVHRIPLSRNSPAVIESRFEYALQYNRMFPNRKKIFFLDETGIQIWSRATYGRAPKGIRSTKRVKAIRSQNYSIASAMNIESLYFFEIQNKSYNSDDYTEFLNKFIQHLANDRIEGAIG